MNVATATSSASGPLPITPGAATGPWLAREAASAATPAAGPSSTPGESASSPPAPPLLPRLVPTAPARPPPHLHPHGPPHGHHPRLIPPLDLLRPPRMPFFIREIYKHGFLKRLPHNERKSSPLSKLMRTDRFWTVFSVHDDAHPFLELWQEPSEVSAGKPPQLVYPLAMCQHVSPSLIAADGEWSFVVNFDSGVAIRFACNSRSTMDEWVECLRHKLGDMGFLPARGNLYSKVPAVSTNKVARNPMSPLPSPPVSNAAALPGSPASTATAVSGPDLTASRNRLSIVDASDAANQSFTTSIYLNQTPPATPAGGSSGKDDKDTRAKAIARRRAQSRSLTNLSMDSTNSSSTVGGGYETIAPLPASSSNAPASPSTTVSTSSVYLNKTVSPNQQRHVTVIPINSRKKMQQQLKAAEKKEGDKVKLAKSNSTNLVATSSKSKQKENEGSNAAVYDAIFDVPRRRQRSPTSRQQQQSRPLSEVNDGRHGGGRLSRREESGLARSPPKVTSSTSAGGGVLRHLSDSRKGHPSGGHGGDRAHERGFDIQQRVRKRSQRSSSLGPLLDEHRGGGSGGNSKAPTPSLLPLKSSATNTNSLESLDSNPRHAPAKADFRLRHNRVVARQGLGGGAVPRRPLLFPSAAAGERDRDPGHHRPGQLPFHHGVHPHPQPPPPPTGFPPHVPLPGLTCQLSLPALGVYL